MEEIEERKKRFARLIEDGRKIEVFTSMPEYQWYVESVVKPTMQEYTDKVMSGNLPSDKEDWIMRGMVIGMKLMIEAPENFRANKEDAQKKAKELLKYQKAMEDDERL